MMKIPQTMDEQLLLVTLASSQFGRHCTSQQTLSSSSEVLAEYGLVTLVDGRVVPQYFLIEKYANQCLTHEEHGLGLDREATSQCPPPPTYTS